MDVVGYTNTERRLAGVVTTKTYLYTFGGLDSENATLTSIERLNLKEKGVFEEYTVPNQQLLKQFNFF